MRNMQVKKVFSNMECNAHVKKATLFVLVLLLGFLISWSQAFAGSAYAAAEIATPEKVDAAGLDPTSAQNAGLQDGDGQHAPEGASGDTEGAGSHNAADGSSASNFQVDAGSGLQSGGAPAETPVGLPEAGEGGATGDAVPGSNPVADAGTAAVADEAQPATAPATAATEPTMEANASAASTTTASSPVVAEAAATADPSAPSLAKSDIAMQAQAVSANVLAEGVYVIRSALGAFVLDVAGGSLQNDANIQIYNYNTTPAQQWRVSRDAQGYYSFQSVKSGLFLDLSKAKVAKRQNIQQHNGNDTLAQKWVLKDNGHGLSIASALDESFVLDVANGNAAPRANIQLYKSNGTIAQAFEFIQIAAQNGAVVKRDTPIAAGEYLIQSRLGSFVLDVAGGSVSDRGNIQIYNYNATEAQKWRVSYDANGYYTIESVKSGKVLDLAGGKAESRTNIQQYHANGTPAQKWIITAKGAYYTIASAVDPMFTFDVAGGKAEPRTNVQAYVNNGTAAQNFTFIPLASVGSAARSVEDGVYTIAAAANEGIVLDVSTGSVSDRANIQAYKSNDTYAQRWGVVYGQDGWYTIFSIKSGKALDVSGAKPLAGTNVQQFKSTNSNGQKWSITRNADGKSYTIASALSGLVLDIAGGVASRANVQMFTPTGGAGQKFVFKSRPIVDEGAYSVLTTCNTGLAIDDPGGSVKDGEALQVYSSNDYICQHVSVKPSVNGFYSLQIVASGKYLTDEDGKVKQRSSRAGDTQNWVVSLGKAGLLFRNAATGNYLRIANSNPQNGTKLTTSANFGAESLFSLVPCDVVSRGIYMLASVASKSSRQLDVPGGSWANDVNAQIYDANNANAQKFLVTPMGDGYYKIAMALSGLALDVAGGSTSAGANVRFHNWNGTDAQLWKPVPSDGGLALVNKKSGMLLEVAGGKDANGANVDQSSSGKNYSQLWLFKVTSVNFGDMYSMEQLVRSVSGSGSVRSSYTTNSSDWKALKSALQNAWNEGFDVGFMLTDVQTGGNISLNADRVYYGASTMKGAYVTWIFQELIETGRVSWNSVKDLIIPTIEDSNNDTYSSLRNRFGSDGFNAWLGGVGLSGWGSSKYVHCTPRELQLMWVRILAYEQSGGRYVNTWRSTFDHSYYSMVNYELGGEKTVYSKPGWYPREGIYGALADSAIVIGSNGRRYLLTIMSDINCYGDQWMEQDIVRALNTIFEASPVL